MISQFKLGEVFLDTLRNATTLPIAFQGTKFVPEVDQDYIAEKEIPTNTRNTIGDGKEVQEGFYQLTVCTPLNKGRFYNLQQLDLIRSKYARGRVIAGIPDAQQLTITTIEQSGIYSDETHLKTALTINYTVIA